MTKYTELKEKYKGKRIILHVVSYLSPMKGTEYAIEAMGYVNKEFPDALLLIITSENNPKRMAELGNLSFKCNTKIEFITNVKDEDMPAYYSIAEVLLAPSLDENVHLPQLEAQSCGCPVVTLRGKQEPEEMVQGKTGFAAMKKNALWLFVRDILKQDKGYKIEDTRSNLSANCRQFILDNFTWDKCIESYKKIIKEVAIIKKV